MAQLKARPRAGLIFSVSRSSQWSFDRATRRRKEPIVPNAAPSLSEGTLAATYQRGPARHEDASEEFLFCNAAEIEITFLNRQLLTHYMGNNSRRTPELQGAIR
jgi:hypothetical protein